MALSAVDHDIISSLQDIQKSSHDPDRQVGVVIADTSGKILSTGTNEPPKEYKYEVFQTHSAIQEDPSWKYYMMEHAERNAILHALIKGISLKDSTMYGTLFPCADCARAIVAAGIVRFVVPKPNLNPARDEKWQMHYIYAHKVFELSGVKVDHYSLDELTRL